MTPEELRKLDAEIQEKIFGFQWYVYCNSTHAHLEDPRKVGSVLYKPRDREEKVFSTLQVPQYSTDIAAAWTIAEKMREEWGQFFLSAGLEWHCYSKESREPRAPEGSGETPMLAICRAALEMVSNR